MTIICKAKKQDLLELYNIEQECFQSDRLSKRSLQNFINHKHHLFLIAKQDEKIAGYLLTLLNPHHKLARHYSLAVLPKYRKQSIGYQLLLASESQIANKQGIKLEVRADNKAAQKLYESLNYKIVKIKSDYYSDGQDATEMIKILNK